MSVPLESLTQTISRRSDISLPQAETTLRATLQALSRQADSVAMSQLLTGMPAALTDLPLADGEPARPVDIADFLAETAAHDGLGRQNVERRVWAVVAAICAHDATAQPLRHVLDAGGPEYRRLLPPPGALSTPDGFITAVRERTGLDEAQAADAVHATLAVVGRDLSPHKIADLQQWLPDPLGAALGAAASGGAEGLGQADITRALAERRGIGDDSARAEARAVMGVVREVLPEPEINKAASQLPDPVAELLR